MLFFICGCLGPSKEELAEMERLKAEEAREAELAAAELDGDKQKSIWDAEHITFEIEWRFGPRFKKALKNRDADQVARCFTDGFVGQPLTKTAGGTRVESSSGMIEQKFAKPEETQELGADAFAADLLEPTQDWESVDAIKLRVLKISKLGDDSWRTRILIGQDGMHGSKRVHEKSEHLVDWTIENNDALEDEPVISRWTMDSRSRGEGSTTALFAEVTSESGLDQADIPDNWKLDVDDTEQYRFGVAVEDFNQDGFLDIAAAVYGGRIQLLQGGPGLKFKDVSRELGLELKGPLPNFLAAWIDYNNDGFPDLLMGNQLYRNEGGKKFVVATRDSGLLIEKECLGATVADYDGDGRLDIYLLYQRDWNGGAAGAAEKWVNEDETGKRNELWKNVGDRFLNMTKMAKAGGGKHHTHSAAWFFYDDDHLPDLYTANDFGENVLLQNNGDGTFKDISEASMSSGFATSMGVATGDINNDGVNEIYVANMFSKMGRRIIAQVDDQDYPDGVYDQIKGSCAGNRLYVRSTSEDSCQELGEAKGISQVGWAFAPAFSDFNNDGLLDIYSTTGFMSFKRGKPDG